MGEMSMLESGIIDIDWKKAFFMLALRVTAINVYNKTKDEKGVKKLLEDAMSLIGVMEQGPIMTKTPTKGDINE